MENDGNINVILPDRIRLEQAEEIIRLLTTALGSRPTHWLGVADKSALRQGYFYLDGEIPEWLGED